MKPVIIEIRYFIHGSRDILSGGARKGLKTCMHAHPTINSWLCYSLIKQNILNEIN